MTIVTLTRFPTDDKLRVHEFETEIKSTFDVIVDNVFSSSIAKAAYLIDDNGKMLDSYIK